MARTRRGLTASLAALLAAAPALAGDKAARGDAKATPADYAAVEFDPIPGLAEALGSREEWLAQMGTRYPTLYLGAALLAKTPEELRVMAAAEPEAVAELIGCINALQEKLAAEAEVMSSVSVRLMAGCCRAGLV